jgi:hypothetical protein
MVRPMIQTEVGGQESWVSAADMMNLLVLNLALFSELSPLNSLTPKTRNSAPRLVLGAMLTCWQTNYQRD